MSASAPTRHRFLVYAPDKAEEGTLEKRFSVRADHLASAKENYAKGFIRVAGALLTPESILSPDAPKKLIGSTFVVEAENIEEIWEWLKKDVYYVSGVWDPEKIIVLPYMIALPPTI